MIETLKKILKEKTDISAWRLKYVNKESQELFFVKKTMDMNRCKNVEYLELTIYMDYEENGIKFRGESSTEIHPTFTEQEIYEAIEETTFAASLIKNEYYPLVKPSDYEPQQIMSNFNDKPLVQWIAPVTEAIFSADVYEKGWVNSTEVFLSKHITRIMNSEGIDVNFTNYSGKVEFIVNWKETSEEIELYKNIDFSEFNPSLLSEKVDEMLKLAKDKASASSTPRLKKGIVLFTGEPVNTLLSYYYYQAKANSVYNKVSTVKIGEKLQGENVEGDLINITLEPNLKGSTKSTNYDNDGYLLSKVDLYTDGILNRYWGNMRYSHYLEVEPTGDIENVVVKGGSSSINELKQEPYLEIIAFSDFQLNDITGDFAGEIRLGWYFDGKVTVAVTGGSISGNIKEVHKKMYLSKEIQQDNNFVGPKTIKFYDVAIAGV